MVDAASISAITVPIFSIVAVPKADRVSPILKQPHAKLAGIDPHNDGLLLWYDSIVARGYLLGYVNADHLAIAVQRRRSTRSNRKSSHRSGRRNTGNHPSRLSGATLFSVTREGFRACTDD